MRRIVQAAGLLLSFFVAPLAAQTPAPEPAEGLVVERVISGSAADRAGVRPGHLLFAWSQREQGSRLRSPYELAAAEATTTGEVMLLGRNGDEVGRWTLAEGSWGIVARPTLSPDLLRLYEAGRRQISSGELDAGAHSWRAAVAEADRQEAPLPAVWLLGRLAQAYVEVSLWNEANEAFEEAARRAREADPAVLSQLLEDWDEVLEQREAALRQLADLLALGSGVPGAAFRPEEARQIEEQRQRLRALRERLLAQSRTQQRPSRRRSPSPAEGIATAQRLLRLAREAEVRGNQPEASDLFRQALAALPEADKGTLLAVDILDGLTRISRESGTGMGSLRQAVAILEHLMPGTFREARARHDLGDLYRKTRQRDLAAQHLCRAAAALDTARPDTVGPPSLREALTAYDRDCLAALVATDRKEQAFRILERQRARSHLAAFEAQAGRLRQALPGGLDAQWTQIESGRERLLASLAKLSTTRETDRIQIGYFRAALDELDARRRKLLEGLRKTAPDLASLLAPEPLGAGAARRALDPGTALLAWSVGGSETFLFVLPPPGAAGPGLEVFRIASDSESLRREVESFRTLVERPGSDPARIAKASRSLYGLLLKPADARIAAADRLLLSPDGPLRVLPFAALIRDPKERRYLVEEKPIHQVTSMSLYASLKRSRPSGKTQAPGRLAALGDPVYPPLPRNQILGATPVRLVAGAGPGPHLPALPSTRAEVEGIAGLFPEARVLLGDDAVEAKANAALRGSRVLHFACHGVFDQVDPGSSALALTHRSRAAQGADGLLQASEIVEGPRLDAGLVTFSASEASPDQADGLAALVRAFQHVGARSVVSSLWRKPGEATAGLMKSFYSHVLDGKNRDEALRQAQLELIRSEGFAHPVHWAAFEVSGDWR